ncbi:MAG: GNAT family N-acetyltransferase [Anaerolineae bacterium]|nr:GNAT family N-acetyltransferase [Anaerolineae bacterium]
MATTHLPAQPESFRGVRPLNLGRDTAQVVRLLNLVFGPTMDQEGQLLDGRTVINGAAPLVTRLVQFAQGAPPGFVWEENRQVVGNVSLVHSQIAGRYLIANVAVHPDYRRRGIAYALMEAAAQAVKRERGRVIYLQVRDDNQDAIHLYQQLGFTLVGTMTTWHVRSSQLHTLDVPTPAPTIRPIRGTEWEEAIELDRGCCHPDLDWPTPVPTTLYKTGFWRWFYNFVNGQQVETWVTTNQGKIVGLAQLTAEFGRPHLFRLRIKPEWQAELSRPLLAKLIRRLGYMRYRAVALDHPADDQTMNDLLRQAGFHPVRTLSTMKCEVK